LQIKVLAKREPIGLPQQVTNSEGTEKVGKHAGLSKKKKEENRSFEIFIDAHLGREISSDRRVENWTQRRCAALGVKTGQVKRRKPLLNLIKKNVLKKNRPMTGAKKNARPLKHVARESMTWSKKCHIPRSEKERPKIRDHETLGIFAQGQPPTPAKPTLHKKKVRKGKKAKERGGS